MSAPSSLSVSLPVAILAGGLATRLEAVERGRVPKSLVEVAGRPFIEHQLALLRSSGVGRVVMCVGHRGAEIAAALGDGRRFGLDIAYAHDGEAPLGTGGALRKALPLLGPRFLFLYGDAYLECDYAAVARAFVARGKRGLMAVLENHDAWDRSNVRCCGDEVVAYDKSAAAGSMSFIDYGLGALTAEALSAYPLGAPFDLGSLQRSLAGARQLAAHLVTRRFYEIGSPAGLRETRRYLEGVSTPPRSDDRRGAEAL
jgi:NDP-sugar pyrophosphorylase family protein